MSARFELLLEGTRTEYYDKGKSAGLKEGRSAGLKEGRSAGIKEGALTTLFGLVDKGKLTLSEASEEASMSEAMFKEKMAEHQRA